MILSEICTSKLSASLSLSLSLSPLSSSHPLSLPTALSLFPALATLKPQAAGYMAPGAERVTSTSNTDTERCEILFLCCLTIGQGADTAGS